VKAPNNSILIVSICSSTYIKNLTLLIYNISILVVE
jgi:hypothetical protein